jgi:hypothetical protein
MKEAKLARSEVEELKENAGIYIFSFLYG